MKHLTHEKISLGLINDWLESLEPYIGSVVTFTGHVRADDVNGKTVTEIIYEGYIEMVENVIEDIISEAISKFGIKDVLIRHRIGNVRVGEIAFLVSIRSKHRKEGFEAIQYVVNEFKKRVPIWKKEIFSDGTSRWKEENHD